MVNIIKNFIKEKTVLIFIILVLFGTFINFASAYEQIGPSINITEEAPEESISFEISVIHTSIILFISSFAIYKKAVIDNDNCVLDK